MATLIRWLSALLVGAAILTSTARASATAPEGPTLAPTAAQAVDGPIRAPRGASVP